MSISKIIKQLGKNKDRGFSLKNSVKSAAHMQFMESVSCLRRPWPIFLAVPTSLPPASWSPSIRTPIIQMLSLVPF